MTQAEYQAILESLNALDLFASQTPLQRSWHAQWQALYQQVAGKIQTMVAKKSAEEDKTPPA